MYDLCFYHSADLDGHCSGAIVKAAFPQCTLFGIDYGEPIQWNVIAGKNVIMVDFSLQPFTKMFSLKERTKSLTWVDHHKSAINEADSLGFSVPGRLGSGRAACELLWTFLHEKQPMPLAVELLGRYDVWDHTDPRTLPFQYGMKAQKDTFPDNQEFWLPLIELHPGRVSPKKNRVQDILDHGHLLFDYQMTQNRTQIGRMAFETTLDGLRLIAANKGLTNSKLFDSVWDSDKYDAMCTFHWRNGCWNFSLYSDRDGVDVSKIAKVRGGGGHKGAAGFQCQELPYGFLNSGSVNENPGGE